MQHWAALAAPPKGKYANLGPPGLFASGRVAVRDRSWSGSSVELPSLRCMMYWREGKLRRRQGKWRYGPKSESSLAVLRPCPGPTARRIEPHRLGEDTARCSEGGVVGSVGGRRRAPSGLAEDSSSSACRLGLLRPDSGRGNTTSHQERWRRSRSRRRRCPIKPSSANLLIGHANRVMGLSPYRSIPGS